jgi:23S rRNA pseudouridine1911/1915/1917 synthase
LDRYLVRLGWADSRRAAVELVASGCVRVNGRRCLKGEPIAAGDRVEVVATRAAAAITPNPDLAIDFLFADEAVIIADKPAPMPCHPLHYDERNTVMNAVVAAYLETAETGEQPLEGGLIHRLDNGTSGALMIARTREAFTAMREALRTARVTRRYLALVDGRLDRTIEIATPIAHHPKNPRKMVVVDSLDLGAGASGPPRHERAASLTVAAKNHRATGATPASVSVRYRSNPRPAFTRVEALSHPRGFTLARVTPRTGNRHQIRVHLASIGYPIAGDDLYGGSPLADLVAGRFWLHLAELEFESPAGGRIIVTAPLARDLTDSLARLQVPVTKGR